MQLNLFVVINVLGVLAFAFIGAVKAIRAQMDVLGVIVVGIVTALGGGVIRDVLSTKIPLAFSSFFDVTVAALGVLCAGIIYKTIPRDISNCYYLVITDALGLAAFTTSGAVAAYSLGVTGFGLVVLATITAVGGGVVGDLFMGKIPSVFRDDFYATCSILGGICFYLLIVMDVALAISSLMCTGITLLLRLLAIHGRWSLPKLS